MTIGLGILLIVVGLIFAFDVINADTSAVDGQALGWILVLGGVLAIVLPLVIEQQRTRRRGVVVDERPAARRTVVEERRVDPPL
ncbi:uncharacterized membrane protein HdeD (DUF308 family) [Marmoricola sp. URHA0025 HA25]